MTLQIHSLSDSVISVIYNLSLPGIEKKEIIRLIMLMFERTSLVAQAQVHSL
jgi:hypothetical protein